MKPRTSGIPRNVKQVFRNSKALNSLRSILLLKSKSLNQCGILFFLLLSQEEKDAGMEEGVVR